MDASALLLVLALGCAAAWLAALAVVGGSTRSAAVDPAPGVFDLPGPEPPAVVNLLANRWKVTRDAVPATMLDLAARGFLQLREDGGGGLTIVLAGDAVARRDELAGFERRLFDQVERSASDGVVPSQALHSGSGSSAGPKNDASSWWEQFKRDVLADARSRGLSRDRWGRRRAWFAAGVLVPAALLWLALDGLLPDSVDADGNYAFIAGAVLGGLGILLLLRLRDERDSPKGREAAALWLGLRQTMATDPSLAAQTAGWTGDRRIAYAAAFGLAPAAAKPLAFGTSEDDDAWSAYGGQWRRVAIVYPKRRRAWGWTPLAAAGAAVGWSAMAALWFWIAHFFLGAGWDGARKWFFLGGLAAALVSVWVWVSWVPTLVAAIVDLSSAPRQVEGLVLRLRRYHIKHNQDSTTTVYRDHYAAVDEGSGDSIDAWWLQRPAWDRLQEGQVVRFTVTPRLGCVRDIQVVGGRPEPQLEEP